MEALRVGALLVWRISLTHAQIHWHNTKESERRLIGIKIAHFMSRPLTCIVTGASRGVGAATARLFAKNGHNVVLNCSKSIEDARLVENDCIKYGAAVHIIQADISTESGCKAVVAGTIDRFSGIDVVINNAGTTKFAFDHSNLDALNSEDFMRIYACNVVGPFNMIKFAKAHLMKSKSPSVVNVASVAGLTGIGSSVAYAASKGALITMTKSFARSLGPIKVNAVCPGFIQGDWLKEGLGAEKYESVKRSIESSTPLNKTSSAEDIAEAIYFFACSQNVITGETLILDGGAHLHNIKPRAAKIESTTTKI